MSVAVGRRNQWIDSSGTRWRVTSPLEQWDAAWMTISEVNERVPLVLLSGGPKDGWVYDSTRIESGPPPRGGVEWGAIQYEDVTILAELEDGRLARVYEQASETAETLADPVSRETR